MSSLCTYLSLILPGQLLDNLQAAEKKRLFTEPGTLASRLAQVIDQIRLLIYAVILVICLAIQLLQKNFINLEVWLPVYFVLIGAFLLNLISYFADNFFKYRMLSATVLLKVDLLILTVLIFVSGAQFSVFIFTYYLLIFLAGLKQGFKGAALMGLWAGALLAWVFVLTPQNDFSDLFFSWSSHLLSFGAVSFLSGQFTDQLTRTNSKLKKSETKLADLNELHELIVRNIASGLIVLNSKGKISFANRQAKKILRKQSLSDLEFSPLVISLPKGIVYRDEVKIEFDEELVWLEVIASPLRMRFEREEGAVVLLQDITEQKKMQRSLQQKEKLAAVGQLAAGIAHEIRNPLASISGSIQMLQADETNYEDKQKLMKIVMREIDRLNHLITEFLEYVKPEPLKLQAVDLVFLLQEITEQIQLMPQFRNTFQIVITPDTKDHINAHRDKLKQALMNILINALQACDKNVSALIKIATVLERGRVVIIIEDNGIGISEKDLGRIFEPFHTTKPKGTGLGLAITYKLVEAMGGEIAVSSRVGEGTCFQLTFDRAPHGLDH